MWQQKRFVILSGAAVSSVVEESSAYQLFDNEKILRLVSLAQDDTVILTVVLIKRDNHNDCLSHYQSKNIVGADAHIRPVYRRFSFYRIRS